MGGKVLRRIEKDLAKRLNRVKGIIFFLDFDGTLTPIRKKPRLVRIGKDTKDLLKRLARNTSSKIFIISGRSLKDIRSLISSKSLYYIGNHGIELKGPQLEYINYNAKILKPFIQKCFKELKHKLRLKGIILENKIYTLSLHYRLVNSYRIPEFKMTFKNIVKPLQKAKKIKITEGKKVLEIRPNIKWDKGRIVNWVLKRMETKNTLPICIGDDMTDEDAFKRLGKKGISILVSGKSRRTYAQYRLESPKKVLDLLKYILRITT